MVEAVDALVEDVTLRGGDVRGALELVHAELGRVLGAVDAAQLVRAAQQIQGSKRVFVAGAGRSGLALQMVAMRLMHLGLAVHVAGEVTAPAIAAGDLLLVASASGTTASMIHAAEVARRSGAELLLLTTALESPLARLASGVVIVPAASKSDVQERQSEQYAGSLFEQAVLLVMDGVFHALWKAGHQSAEELLKRHANLE